MVLIVDNDKTRVALLRCILEKENIEVRTANSGFEMITVFNEDRPRIAILDPSILWINACDFIHTCRENKRYESTVFILLSKGQNYPISCKMPNVEIVQYPIRVHDFIRVVGKYIAKKVG